MLTLFGEGESNIIKPRFFSRVANEFSGVLDPMHVLKFVVGTWDDGREKVRPEVERLAWAMPEVG